MDTKQIELVRKSFRLLVPVADDAAKVFYDRLFTIRPDLRSLFSDDMTEQRKKLMQTIGFAVGRLDQLDTITGAVQELGKRHKGYQVKAEDYMPVGEALIWTLATLLPEQFTPEVEAAWIETYETLAGVMIEASEF